MSLTNEATNTIEVQESRYMKDATGRLVPLEQIRPIDLARDELVREKIAKAKALQKDLQCLKYEIMGDIEAFIAMSAERFDVKVGGTKGNVKLASFDGAFYMQRQMSEHVSFDEGLQAAKSLIDECLRDWMQGSCSELKTIIDDAFQVDKEGRINTARILALRRHNIEDERWQRAMTAISDSLQVTDTRAYVRLYERDIHGKYNAISLDIASL